MLHNSLFWREMLLAMNKEPHVLRRREVHRTVGRKPGAKAPAGWLALEGNWAIQPARNDGVERAVAIDAKDFFENTRAAGKVYEAAPWLNHKLRLDIGVNDSVKMIEAKVQLLKAYLTRK